MRLTTGRGSGISDLIRRAGVGGGDGSSDFTRVTVLTLPSTYRFGGVSKISLTFSGGGYAW